MILKELMKLNEADEFSGELLSERGKHEVMEHIGTAVNFINGGDKSMADKVYAKIEYLNNEAQNMQEEAQEVESMSHDGDDGGLYATAHFYFILADIFESLLRETNFTLPTPNGNINIGELNTKEKLFNAISDMVSQNLKW